MRYAIFALVLAACASTPPDSDPAPPSKASSFCPVNDECQFVPLKQYGDQWIDDNYPTAEKGRAWDCSVAGSSWCSTQVRIDYYNQTFVCVVMEAMGMRHYYCYEGPDFAPTPAVQRNPSFCPVGDDCLTLPVRQYGDQWLNANYPTAERTTEWECHKTPLIFCTRTIRVDYYSQSFECLETEEDGQPSSLYCYVGPDLAPATR